MATKNKNKKQILLFVQIAKLIIGDEAWTLDVHVEKTKKYLLEL